MARGLVGSRRGGTSTATGDPDNRPVRRCSHGHPADQRPRPGCPAGRHGGRHARLPRPSAGVPRREGRGDGVGRCAGVEGAPTCGLRVHRGPGGGQRARGLRSAGREPVQGRQRAARPAARRRRGGGRGAAADAGPVAGGTGGCGAGTGAARRTPRHGARAARRGGPPRHGHAGAGAGRVRGGRAGQGDGVRDVAGHHRRRHGRVGRDAGDGPDVARQRCRRRDR